MVARPLAVTVRLPGMPRRAWQQVFRQQVFRKGVSSRREWHVAHHDDLAAEVARAAAAA
jgi:hypothetical protein